ncbi:proline racemase family protein [Polycladidibacter hongkongensis]|uniref:4-hydroxyproline epimerase n=1 Tax=Polycladidibacter hongkongensis TaxID=1647556 RepID=UPI00082CF8F5|nr:proline racemase family protein [Pseudovibrio hongkongensis]
MRVIDSHTAGEPTRLVLEGGPSLGDGSLAERALRLEQEHGDFCKAVLLEPRGHDAIVGALLVPANAPDCVTGVIYFNPAGNLGMCGHATIGLAVTLAHLGRIGPGVHRFETPVGVVSVELHDTNTVSVVNVPSYRYLKDIVVVVPGVGPVRGDVAWGGNWFFLTKDGGVPLEYEKIPELAHVSLEIRRALASNGITGADGGEIDHVELIGPAKSAHNHGRNFVMCPGGAYDRSPCGTGTSAKVACLAADGLLAAHTIWRQESIIDSTYELFYVPAEGESAPAGAVLPTVKGSAYVTAQSELLFDANDPYISGIRGS